MSRTEFQYILSLEGIRILVSNIALRETIVN